ncbi:formylglycine-generating enzyme family protein [Leucothrix pacifica]|uniref:Formylglycine-generating enzyme family protein n=1 Tax=Leucothrix pacifica TaxID=1247513 RepID=A0A317CEN6_9GAMM|nr:formylglycine-generating enzyme family protein [Leucothrix pacifica]PWQ97124.1 formylglycine-generating enzyme family protein [Leucothrix pacifica]
MFNNRIHKIYPKIFPQPWASGWGEDEFGLWMSFTYKGVQQAFRWCEPGVFLMGSPDNEPERVSSETQHEVELGEGFWIADTTVTQALWEVVMEGNPSSFNGKNNPVDSVSWEDAQMFINKINTLEPELKLCLPSEVQWEYACRAETTTSFYFGDQIDFSEVNFDARGVHVIGNDRKYRRKTVAVKLLPPNNWGLYAMHGNVWEWCQDWYVEYPNSSNMELKSNGSLTSGIDKGRVLRGGSWLDGTKGCRSACRYYGFPSFRNNSLGFRLSLNHHS